MSRTVKVRTWIRLAAVLLPCLIFGNVALGVDLHVDSTSTAVTPDGLTWATSFKFLQDALAVTPPPVRIKVAQGMYHPDDKTGAEDTRNRSATFTMINGVLIEGGYAGLAGADPDLRDLAQFETILSGDLNDDDDPMLGLEQPNRAENSLSVVNGGVGTGAFAKLDGFTIQSGHGGYCDDLSFLTVVDCA